MLIRRQVVFLFFGALVLVIRLFTVPIINGLDFGVLAESVGALFVLRFLAAIAGNREHGLVGGPSLGVVLGVPVGVFFWEAGRVLVGLVLPLGDSAFDDAAARGGRW